MRVTWATYQADGTYTTVEVEDVEAQDLPVVFAMKDPELVAQYIVGPIQTLFHDLKEMFQ